MMVVCPGSFSVVVVEGCPKSMKRYHKLMLRRIDWNEKLLPTAGDDDADAADEEQDEEQQGKPPNSCHLVWQVGRQGGAGQLATSMVSCRVQDE